jgi:hypothetical protein
MRKIREVLRLKFGCGKSNRDIGKSCGIGRSTVADYLLRASAARLTWPLPEELDDCALEKRLFTSVESFDNKRITPEWSDVHQELKRKGVTLKKNTQVDISTVGIARSMICGVASWMP